MSLTAWSSNRVYPHHRLRTRLRSGRGTTARKVNGLCPILLRCQWPGASTSWRVNPVLTPAGRRIDLVGLENIPESGPLIVALNHQDALVDPMLLLGRIPRRFGAGCQGATVPPPAHRPLLAPGGRVARPPPAEGGVDPARSRAMFSAATAHLGASQAVLMPLRAGAGTDAVRGRSRGGQESRLWPSCRFPRGASLPS